MGLFFTILKFFGIAMTGALGILGTVTETQSSTGPDGVKKLNRWGRWALGLTIAGLALALASQLAEEISSRRTAQESERTSRRQTDVLLALLTRFDRIEVASLFELPREHQSVKNLADELDKLMLRPLDRIKDST